MRIYHGSTEIIENPTILEVQRLLDFGKGFYTTTNKKQAERWAIIKRNRIGGDTKSFVSICELDENLLYSKRFNVQLFGKTDENWLDFIIENRRSDKPHPFDIVMGAVANDTLYQTLTLYETGLLTKLETISRLKAHVLFDQLSFHTSEVLNEVNYISSYEITTPVE